MAFLVEAYKQLTNLFSPLEQRLIQAFIDELPSETASIISRQVAQYNKIQRLYSSGAVEINLYKTRFGFIVQEPDVKFPVQEEMKLGTLDFHPENDKSARWTADFYAVNGRFFSIVIRPNPKSIQQSSIEIVSVDLQDDPLQSKRRIDSRQPIKKLTDFPGWLQRWQRKYEISDLSEPLSNQLGRDLLAKINARLPSDYLELLTCSNGMVINGCSILGLSEIYRIHLPDSDYFVLAEIHGRGILGIKADGQDYTIYYCGYESQQPEAYGTSFHIVVEEFLED